MASPSQDDLTPISGAQTDVAPLGRSGPKPAHELTADEERGTVDWDGIAALPDFKALVAAKVRFIVIGTIFFCIYYFLLLVLVGYAPELMKKMIGPVNLAYAFGFSQFFMAWILAAIYVKAAAGWDRRAAAILSKTPVR